VSQVDFCLHDRRVSYQSDAVRTIHLNRLSHALTRVLDKMETRGKQVCCLKHTITMMQLPLFNLPSFRAWFC